MEPSNQSNNYSATVYVNHYEWFTDEHLKIYNNGQQFKFAYHEEVQQFYEYRPTHLQNGLKPQKFRLESPNQINQNKDVTNINYVEVLSVIPSPSVSDESSISTVTKQSLNFNNSNCDKNSRQTSSKSSNSSESSNSRPELKEKEGLNFSSKSSNSSQSLNLSSNINISPKTNQLTTDQNKDFLQQIRDFKFSNTQHQNPISIESKKPQLFQTSNPLLTSSYLHQQLDNFREQMRTPSDIDINDSLSSQWELE